MKNKEVIQKEIDGLREIKPKVRHYSAFGDDNWKQIEAQIETLERGYDEDDIYNRYENPDVLNSALQAYQWANDMPIEDSDTDNLVESWGVLVTK